MTIQADLRVRSGQRLGFSSALELDAREVCGGEIRDDSAAKYLLFKATSEHFKPTMELISADASGSFRNTFARHKPEEDVNPRFSTSPITL